jgi:hypothetical protein
MEIAAILDTMKDKRSRLVSRWLMDLRPTEEGMTKGTRAGRSRRVCHRSLVVMYPYVQNSALKKVRKAMLVSGSR